jgi:squalene cyclase
MSYYFTKIVDQNFDKAIENVTEELKKEGFWNSYRNRCEGNL